MCGVYGYAVLAGDFNINLLSGSKVQTDYLNVLADFNLIQHIDKPSQSCVCNNSATLINHVNSSQSLQVSQSIQATDIVTTMLRLYS